MKSTHTEIAMSEEENLGEEIRSAGGRATRARIHVLGVIRNNPVPVSFAEMTQVLLRDYALLIDKATLYRILHGLVEMGLAHRAPDAMGVLRYSPSLLQGQHSHHAHFRCLQCGGVFCLPSVQAAAPKLPNGFLFTAMAVDVRGHCNSCQVQS